MTELEFFPFHNYHIRFRLSNGTELSGVLFDTMNSHETGKPRTEYTFIQTKNMIEWKQAEKIGDKERMKHLQSFIDITDIVWAERLKY